MSVDFGVLLAQPRLVLALVAGFLTLKIGVLVLLSQRFQIARGQRLLFAILLSQGGEFAFVVFGAAATAKVFRAGHRVLAGGGGDAVDGRHAIAVAAV
ncbi:hypothetical protein ACFS07_00990 [Undibacterium arcticum]